MVENRPSVFDKSVKLISDCEKKNKLLTTRQLAQEVGVSGAYLQALKEKLRSYGVADFIEFRGAKYWFSLTRISKQSKAELEHWIWELFTKEHAPK